MSGRPIGQWWDESWNPITGCTPISPGCDHCWASGMAKRFQAAHQSADFSKIAFHPNRLGIPSHFRKPRRIFVCSVGDFWHPDVSPIQRALVFDVIWRHPWHTFILLTKRAKEMHEDMTNNTMMIPFTKCNNVIAMVTVENQEMADERIPYLLKTPFSRRGVSIEPMLGGINLRQLSRQSPNDDWTYFDDSLTGFIAHKQGGNYRTKLDWVILGGETGPGARKCDYEWAFLVRDQCEAAGVPFFYKGIGTHKGVKKSAMHYYWLGGKTYQQFPEVAR